MATITLTDSSSFTANVILPDSSVLGKTPNAVLHFLRSDVIGALDQPLDKLQINAVSIGFNYQPSFTAAGGTATFSAGGGMTGQVTLYKPSVPRTPSPLFPTDQFGADIEMHGSYYLALGFQLSLSAQSVQTAGAFTLTPTAGVTGTATLYLPCAANAAGAYPSLKQALIAVGTDYALPGSVDEMKRLPAGTVFTYDAQGSIALQAQLELLTAVNPTASLGVSKSVGPLAIDAGPQLTIGGVFSIAGDFQVRMWNKDGNIIQLGYYKKRSSTFTISYDASAGLEVAAGSYDVIAKIYGMLGSTGKLTKEFLATLPPSVAGEVEEAYEAAVQTKLSIAIDEECDTTFTDQAAFSWNFDIGVLDAAGQQAFANAMKGDVSQLVGQGPLPAGVTKAGSVFDRIRSSKHTFIFNFLGLFDYAHVEDAARSMSVKASEDGQLVIADQATMTRLSATATPFVKSDLLRKVLSEDFIATMGYSSSFGPLASNLKVSYSYYDYLRWAHTSDLQMFVSTAAILVGKDNPENDWALLIRSGISSQSSSMLASLAYDNDSATALFLDSNSDPRSIGEYQRIGRQALILAPGLNLNAAFVSFLSDDGKWQRLVDAGAVGNFYQDLGVDPGAPPQWATVAYAWKTHVLLWAAAMHSSAQAMKDVRQYVAGHPTLDPLQDAAFNQKRSALASQLKAAVQATPLFNDTLGISTIYLSARPSTELVGLQYAGKETTYS